MSPKPPTIFLLFSLLILAHCDSTYHIYKHPESSSAKCIDGSPAALYITQGETDKILIYFEGGGMCYGMDLASTVENCYNRSRTALGSSVNYTPTKNFNQATVLSNDPKINPLYATWTKVYIPYCDGVLHQGTRNSSIQYKGKQLYLRGMNITLANFQYLDQKYGLFSAQKVVLTGTSAGAMAALAWANTAYGRMTNPKGLLVIFDSGQFVSDYFNPFTNSTPGVDAYVSIKNLAFTEAQAPLDQCLKVESRKECDKFGVLINYIIPPVFAIESEYDLFAIRNILQLRCPELDFPASLRKCNETEMRVIEDYRNKSVASWGNLTKYEKNGIWGISCSQHGFLYNYLLYDSNYYRVPEKTGPTILKALQDFVSGSGPRINIDSVAWPHNDPCRGYMNLNVDVRANVAMNVEQQ